MKRRLLVLWMAMVVGMALLSMCGGSRVGYQGGYDTAYRGQARGAYSAGGGSAGWDTATVIFSPETLVDAAVDTFGLPTSGQIAADVARVVYLNDVLLGRRGQGKPASFIKLGAGGVTSFAYANISNYSPTPADTIGYINASGDRIMLQSATSFISAGIRFLDLSFPQILRKSELVYIPFEDYIPANATIVSASVNVSSASAPMLLTYTDSIIAQPLHPAWDKWMLVKDVGSADNLAHAAWSSQESTGPAGAWGGTTRYPWVPDLDYLPRLWDVSQVSDWTGVTGPDVPEKSNLPIYITNTVQSFINGAPNTGFMMNLADYGAFTMSIQHFRWDPSTTATRRMPAVIVKYITKRYQKPFGTSDWAFVFQTDDLGAIANNVYADTMEARGGKFTMFGFKQYNTLPGLGVDGVNDQTRRLSLAELFDIYNRGNEYGSHSKFHSPSKGYHNRIVASGQGIASAAYDSMVVDFGPNWMYAIADSARALGIINEDMRDSPRFAKSFGAPVSFLEAYAQRVLVDHGYKAWRTLGSTGTYDREKYYSLPAAGYRASADSAAVHPAHAARHVRNIREQFPDGTHQLLVGQPDSNSTSLTHLPKVVNNMKRKVFQVRGNDTRIIYTFTHDLKSGGSGFYTGEGVNADELGRMCYVTNLLNGRYMTAAEIGEWQAAGSTFIDHPFNSSRPDTFRMYADDRVWVKPNGIDNRWIRGVRTPAAVTNSFDTAAPLSPTLYVASGSDATALVLWAPSLSPDVQYYNVYRFFDGSADTVKVGTATSAPYYDNTAINGSPHNYYVTAVDYAGNESDPSATMATTPGTILPLNRPAYWAFWYQDPADLVPLDQADVAKLAEFDMIVGSPHSLEGPEMDEVGFDGLLGRIRAINPDFVYLTYYTAFCAYDYWADSPPLSVHKRVWEYMASLPDSSGFGKDESGNVVYGDDYPGQVYNNVMIPSMADTIAKILVETYENSGTDGEWAGFFLDDSDTSLSEWMCNGNDCGDIVDFDQDGTSFSEGVNGDPEEKAAFKDWHLRLVRAIRREFAERGMQNRLVTANTTWGRKADPSPKDDQYMGLLDGMLNEAWNLYWPGHATTTNTATWDMALDWRYQLTHAQTSPPLVMWNARSDSSAQYMNEVLAYANGGLVNANSGSDWSSDSSAPVMGRKNAALAGGTLATAFYDTVAGNATPDTLTVITGDLTARMVLGRNEGDLSNQYAVWPYLITKADGTILSRSAFWELPEEEGPPPPSPQFIAVGGDNEVTVIWSAAAYPTDFSHVHIYRTPYANVDSMRLFISGPVSMSSSYGDREWTDATAANDSQYCYAVSVVDMNGRESELSDFDCATPSDDTAPTVPQNLKVAGGDGYVDLDWNNSLGADIVGYYISRALDDGDGAPGTFTARQDSVTISAYQDETAISGQNYFYYVRAYDDDGNISAPSDTAFGGWIGSPPTTYLAPQLVRVIQNYTATATAVLVYPPNDVTGLTGYTVYRGPWNGIAATDTTVCIKRISINATPDAFNAHTFIDNTANTTPDSAFQYTAVALYSGNRSKKYSPPAGAFTDGGFAVTTPTLAAFGNGTNILLAVGSVSGADSTRVYRGTGAGTQTSLASINALDNPYTDTTAAANTDYWYKVRQYDVATAQWSNYSAVSGPVRWNSVPSGDPTISGVNEGVDNTVQHGESVVIAGSSFGTKASGPPVAFDNIEDGFDPAWSNVYGLSAIDAVGHARHANSTKHGYKNFNESGGDFGSLRSNVTGTRFFASYWFKLTPWTWGTTGASGSDSHLANVKFMRWHSSNSLDNMVMAFHHYGTTDYSKVENPVYDGCSGATGEYNDYVMGGLSSYLANGNWHHIQVEYIDSSSVGASDAAYKLMLDGNQMWSDSGFVGAECAASYPKFMYQIGLMDSWPNGTTRDNGFYIDDAYYDTTIARVEIGNASTYAACTHREIQIPSAWSATSVTINANTGSFANGAAYLFVIDEDGTASAGQAITISN
jgi:fibronectin type 3 domain-containing protein